MKKIDKSKKFLIVGLGLLGGCYAMALKKKGFFVSAITKEQADVDYALKKGIIDEGSVSVDREEMRSMMRISAESLIKNKL